MASTDGITERELIRSDATPDSAPYSTAVAVGDLVWTSGTLPVEPDGTVAAGFRAQVRTALLNLEASLRAAGADWSTVVKINGYVADIEQLPVLNEVYSSIVTVHGAPARTTVEVARFRGDTQVEFDAVAHRRLR